MSNAVTSSHLLAHKIKHASVNTQDAYAQGFIKACADAQVEPEQVMEVIELLDIHL